MQAANHRMLTGCLPGEHTLANQALEHVFTKNSEDLSKLVAALGARVSLRLFVSSHVDQQ
jgi:hypothetical protein